MLHKQSHTFLLDLKLGKVLGEIGVFKNELRSLTAKARDFTEVYCIKKSDLYELSENFTQALQ